MAKKILVTGGTVFVSRYVAEYYVRKGAEVYVLNRGSKPQAEGVTLLQADRHELGEQLRSYHFDAILDVTAYDAKDVEDLLDAVGSYDAYVLISSSAVYPEYVAQPFAEDGPVGENRFWKKYGTDKIVAELALLQRDSEAYVLRPPYLYGPMNNVYREAFVFDCALQNRKFYLPKDGQMKLQFLHVEDLCRFIDVILEQKPGQHIFNVGNQESVSVRDWVRLCYQVVGKEAEFVNVTADVEQRKYFPFYDYEYSLDVTAQEKLMPETRPLEDGLREAFAWYATNGEQVNRKNYFDFIDKNLG